MSGLRPSTKTFAGYVVRRAAFLPAVLKTASRCERGLISGRDIMKLERTCNESALDGESLH